MDEAVHKANIQLSRAGCKVKLTQRRAGGSLSLVGTFPPKPGSHKSKPHQQKISLKSITGFSVLPHAEGIKRAVAEAKRLDSTLTLNLFNWNDYSDIPADRSKAPIAGALIPKFEAWYFETRGRSGSTETTWETDYWEVYKRIDPEARLTQDLLEDLIRRTKPNSRSRKRYYQALKKLAEFGELEVNLKRIQELKGNYSSESVEPKTLLTDEEIEELWSQIDEPWLRLCFGYLVTFGLRNHELYYLDNQALLEGGYTIIVGRNTKSKRQRVAYALPRQWIEQFELRQEFKLEPTPGKTNRRLGEVFSQAFLNRNLPSPYTFRHCWRERAIRWGVDPSVAAKSLGHSVSVSQQHYTAWISEKTCDLAFERAEEIGRNAGSVPQS